ncbi:MAG TPA: Plug domain-containing protein [Gemmatimonadaceae bacterium]|nr:Plug domain-containing protein [Gemmatimonadaceae bacterium]
MIRSLVRSAGLGLLVGAVLHGSALAQSRDTVRTARDTVHAAHDTSRAVRDTIRAARDTSSAKPGGLVPVPGPDTAALAAQKRDTIKAPLAHAESPVLADPVGSYRWQGDEIMASGAYTLADLLDRVPGVTTLRGGFIAAPSTAVFMGDAQRVRVFLDGVELRTLDPHAGGALDYARIPLWPLEEVTVERGASEVRVYLRTWRVDRTTPYTRTDINTGDQQTNLYRAFFGRRFSHGEALQLGVQQYGTTPSRISASSDQLSLMARLGWAHRAFSVDGFLMQVGSHRGQILDQLSGDSLPQLETTARDAYVRLGLGDPDAGPWMQAVAASSRYTFATAGHDTTSGISGSGTIGGTTTDSTRVPGDTIVSRAQYTLSGGLSRWGLRMSAMERLTAENHVQLRTPSVRVSTDWHRLSISAFAEGKGIDSTSRQELSAVLLPLSFIRLSGAVGTERDTRMADSALSPQYTRAEASLRIHDFWLTGGMIRRGAVSLAAPGLVADSLETVREPSATATYASVRGRLWKAVYGDAWALKWNDSTGFYRPQYQERSRLYVSTSLIDRFPRNTFHFYAGLTHEYRSATFFPIAGNVVRLQGYRSVSALVEIRILRGTLTYQLTNVLGEKYTQIPGFLMPRQSSYYGVRWEFWN